MLLVGLCALALLLVLGMLVRMHRQKRELARANAALHAGEQRLTLAMDGARDALWDWNVRTGRVYFSPRWYELLGLEPQGEGPPSIFMDLLHPEDRPRADRAIRAHILGETPRLEMEHRVRHADGSWRWVLCRGVALRSDDEAVRLAGSLTDITERKETELKLRSAARRDPLTGLANRTHFFAQLADALDHDIPCALVFIDLDRFKVVNDHYGHVVGDSVLEIVAKRLAGLARSSDVVARVGGDEFVVLLRGADAEAQAEGVAARIRTVIAERVRFGDFVHELSASTGVAVGRPGVSPAELVHEADDAMYASRRPAAG